MAAWGQGGVEGKEAPYPVFIPHAPQSLPAAIAMALPFFSPLRTPFSDFLHSPPSPAPNPITFLSLTALSAGTVRMPRPPTHNYGGAGGGCGGAAGGV